MRIKLAYFLSKRGISLKKLCEKCGIKTHEDLESYLDRAGVEYPDRVITDKFLKDRKIVSSKVIKPIHVVEDPVLTLSDSSSEISTTRSVKVKKKVSPSRKKTQRKKRPAKHSKKPAK